MAKYRKKPVVIEAEQFFADRKPWPEGVEEKGLAMDTFSTSTEIIHVIRLQNGWLEELSEGAWIITGVNGEKYPIRPDIFELTYEAVMT